MTKENVSARGQVALTSASAFGVMYVEPVIADYFPNLPEPLSFLTSAILSGATAIFLFQIAFARPAIHVKWLDSGQEEIHEEIIAKVRNVNTRNAANDKQKNTEPFRFSVTFKEGGFLGNLLLEKLIGPETRLQVRIDNAPIQPTIEHSSLAGRTATVVANSTHHGADVILGKPPKKEDTWHTAEIRWSTPTRIDGVTYRVSYEYTGGRKTCWRALNFLFRIKSGADKFKLKEI